MPEGHTVHRLARTFADIFLNHEVAVSSPQGRFVAGAERLDGSVLRASEACGKHLFLGFEPADSDPQSGVTADPSARNPPTDLLWLRVHLGLYGAWTFAADASTAVVHAMGAPRTRIGERERVLAPPTAHDQGDDGHWEPPHPQGAVRVRLASAHACADLTGPTACEVITTEQAGAIQHRLGPDPLRSDAVPEAFIAAVTRSRSPIGVLLMNQEVLAGVGNIYRAEALFRAGQPPLTPGSSVRVETVRAIWDDLVILMADGARTGAIVTTRPEDRGDGVENTDPRRRTRQNADGDAEAVPQSESFYVYQRAGQPCRVCGEIIAMADLAGRNLFWCPRCQDGTSGQPWAAA